MKNRVSQDVRDEKTKNYNKKKRLGGRGLSLEAFANAKTKNNNYNPAIISKFPLSKP